jgi:hypothetical protein
MIFQAVLAYVERNDEDEALEEGKSRVSKY